MKNKKSIQLNQAFGAVLTLVLVALLVIVAIYLVSSLQTSFPLTTLTTTNESGYINQTGYTLKNMSLCRATSPAIVTVYNTTDSVVIASGNWTLNTTSGVITNASATTWKNVKIIYTNQWGDAVCTASDSVITQFATYPTLIGLVGTIIFLAIVIGVLVASFAFGGRRGA